MVWLVAIVVVGAVVWILAGWLWGLLAALAALVVSEVVERNRRSRLRRERGDDTAGVSVRDAIGQRRRR